MIRVILFGPLFLLLLCVPALPAQEPSEAEAKIEKVLRELEEFGRRNFRMNVPPDHGRFLMLMTEVVKAKRVLEIGTSNGYSGIWLARGLRRTGGKLITIEIHAGRFEEAKKNFAQAGVDHLITLHHADAFKIIPTLTGEFDIIFLDANKPDYLKFFEMLFPKLRPGGVILAHNAVAQASRMRDFLDAIHKHPGLISNVVQMGRDGFSVSVKRWGPEQ